MKNTLLALIFCLALLGSSCSWLFPKDKYDIPTSLPPITERGANTFGCLINADLMVTNGCIGRNCNTNPGFDPAFGFQVNGAMHLTNSTSKYLIVMNMTGVNKPSMHLFDTIVGLERTTRPVSRLTVYKYVDGGYTLSTADSGTYCHGQLIITKWQQGTVPFVSGTFWFDIYNPREFADTVRVRDGRFDVGL